MRYPTEEESHDTNARRLDAHRDYLVLIEGHADERGTNEYNLALGERRAKAAMSASEALFQRGWFVESLATRTLVLFATRTAVGIHRIQRPSHRWMTGRARHI